MRLAHTPGEYYADLLEGEPGRALVLSRDGDTVHPVARCASHDAALLALARHAPHECGHEGCPGREAAERLAALVALRAAADEVLASVQGFPWDQLRAAVGQDVADGLWRAVMALQGPQTPAASRARAGQPTG